MEIFYFRKRLCIENSFYQFLEFEQGFCLGLLGHVSWDLYLSKFIIKPLLAICSNDFPRMTTLWWPIIHLIYSNAVSLYILSFPSLTLIDFLHLIYFKLNPT